VIEEVKPVSKTINTTKTLPFKESAKLLFCNDCKKQFPGCKPTVMQIEDTWLEAGFEHEFRLVCEGENTCEA